MSSRSDAQASVHSWLSEPVSDDVSRVLRKLARIDGVARIAVMPDVHLAYGVCIGTVLGARGLIFPEAVGSDIGCGMTAMRFDVDADRLVDQETARELFRDLESRVPVHRHSRETAADALPERLLSAALSEPRLERLKAGDARVQWGTLGRGNHFLEFQADEAGALWVMIHSGSRGIGQAIAQHHARSSSESNRGLVALGAHEPEGIAYFRDQEWARQYALENRARMLRSVTELVDARFRGEPDLESRIECDHNHVRREVHDEEELWVHRKGALSARDGEPGIIPGSMGSPSYLVTGRGDPLSLSSSSHGAGRALSRTRARRSVSPRQLRQELDGVIYDERRTHRLREEAPSAYKDIGKVMRAQRGLTRILTRLEPRLSYKGN